MGLFQGDKMKRLILLLAIVSILPSSTPIIAQAEDYVIATIDMDRILNESKAAQQKRKQLSTLSENKKKSIEAKKVSLKDFEDKLKKQKVAEDSKEADQFRAQARDLSRLVKDAEEDLKKQYIKTTKELLKDAHNEIEKYAKANNIALVLEKNDRSAASAVLFGTPGLDITDKIVASLNK